MNPRQVALFLIVVAVSLISCGQKPESPPAEVEPAAPAAVETGPDPTVVDPDHYKVEFENEYVRVLRITYGPGETSSMHYHPDLVAVFDQADERTAHADDVVVRMWAEADDSPRIAPRGVIVDGPGHPAEDTMGNRGGGAMMS